MEAEFPQCLVDPFLAIQLQPEDIVIAGTDGLVTVTGPAGAGKTTMLRVAFAALTSQRRRMLVVAPTRKAASVASREVGAAASSIHALLSDHGYRWGTDKAGALRAELVIL